MLESSSNVDATISRSMPRVFIGIGSNVDRERNIRSAVVALAESFGAVTCSPVYRTKAVGFEGDDFYNLVAEIDTDMTITAVAATLREIESHHGRHRGEAKFAPRTIDLDLLLYGDAVGDYAGVTLPRPDIMEYAFVLRPLADLAPHQMHPTLHRSYRDLWQARAASMGETPDVVADFSLPDQSSARKSARGKGST
jgi:2-amino-4-hydroxy-6-hydroxymethyldihydropteridine diphosphokinase